MVTLLYGTRDIALALGVTNAAVSNWLRRYGVAALPAPVAQMNHARYGVVHLWDSAGVTAWIDWHANA